MFRLIRSSERLEAPLILYQPTDFDFVHTALFVPKILPGVFRYTGDCRYSSIRCNGDLSNPVLEDIYTSSPIDPISWLIYITHPVIAAGIDSEINLGLFAMDEVCFLFDWVDSQAYLGRQDEVLAFFGNIHSGWILPPIRRDISSFELKFRECVDHQATLDGLLRITLDQRLRLN